MLPLDVYEKIDTHQQTLNISNSSVGYMRNNDWSTRQNNFNARDFVFVTHYLALSCLLAFSCLKAVDNIRLKQLNQKIKDLIAGITSVLLGNTEITNITNNLNDLSEVIRLTQRILSRKVKIA